MLFATNRVFEEGPTARRRGEAASFELPRSVNFKLSNNQAEQSIYFCQRDGKDKYQEIGHTDFFRMLKGHAAQHILFYIHGYSNLPEKAIFPRTEELQRLFGNDNVLVVPLIWPCDDDLGFLQDYFDDQDAADASDFAFMRFFEWFFAWIEQEKQKNPGVHPLPKQLHVLTHSMGARVLQGAVNRAVKKYQFQGFPNLFRNIFLSAPDITDEALEKGQSAAALPAISKHVVVYYAWDDWTLSASTVVNLGNGVVSQRLGQHGPQTMSLVPQNVYAVDCGKFNNQYDDGVVKLGHGYFGADKAGKAGLLFQHMEACIKRGEVPLPAGERKGLLTAESLGHWLRA